ncbi:hypothetical protein SKAU_G00099870 [Synaphobranchus kaupii]|uniref:Uncharacterized protein n=1 Tax=Synaphobranchus kaupii TaxID=118154 RepID=A0A9Q1FYY8_SYNKA|nr:hypothetical protein SKAU_G00099870 [Synaphobranchus kaupii]
MLVGGAARQRIYEAARFDREFSSAGTEGDQETGSEELDSFQGAFSHRAENSALATAWQPTRRLVRGTLCRRTFQTHCKRAAGRISLRAEPSRAREQASIITKEYNNRNLRSLD